MMDVSWDVSWYGLVCVYQDEMIPPKLWWGTPLQKVGVTGNGSFWVEHMVEMWTKGAIRKGTQKRVQVK